MFDFVNQYFDHAARWSDHAPGLLDQIKSCNSIYRFNFPFRRADGNRGDSRLARGAQPPQPEIAEILISAYHEGSEKK